VTRRDIVPSQLPRIEPPGGGHAVHTPRLLWSQNSQDLLRTFLDVCWLGQ
jgi:hypothetical protein